ncbi:lectin-like [Primulina eburnea]|uniref:lectin-like n=1 Tax=Primulina eburnea TaxID=1245227 RepID=UPI003C6C6D78
MGAGSSQEKDEASHPNKDTTNPPITYNTDGKATSSATTQVPLPHNWEGILKDGGSPTEKSSTNTQQLHDQLYAGIFLNQNRKKYWVDKETNNNCFMLFARDLSITWAEDNRFWNWPLVPESSNVTIAAAELLDVCWLEVHGRFQIASLSPGTTYEVIFIVKLNEPVYGWEVPVNLRLTLPDGSRQEHKENLMEKPRGRWIQIPAGEVRASAEKVGEMEFSLYEYEGGQWKRGLLIKGVSIQPKA